MDPSVCPITQIQFVANNDDSYLKNPDYTVVGEIGGGRPEFLVYSKTHNAMPVTLTYVG